MSEVRSFLGISNNYRRVVKNYSTIASSLNQLLKNNHQFKLRSDCAKSFTTLIKLLKTTPILSFFTFKKQFSFDCDASDFLIGAVLFQLHDNIDYVMTYYSRSISRKEHHYFKTRKELLAFVSAVNYFGAIFWGINLQYELNTQLDCAPRL